MHRKHFLTLFSSRMGGIITYSIGGIVYDANGVTPVEGATISFGLLTATSAVDGTYTISNVAAGTSGSLTCTKTGYSWDSITISAISANLTAQNYTNAWWAAGGCAAKVSAAYSPKDAASLAASYLRVGGVGGNANLDPAVVGVGVAPTWDAVNGWIFNGTTQFLSSGVIPENNQEWGMVVQWSDLYTNTTFNCLGGVSYPSGKGFMIAVATYVAPDNYLYYNGDFLTKTGIRTAARGVSAISGATAYFNGVAEVGSIGPSVDVNTLDAYIGTAHVEAGAYFGVRQDKYIQKIAFYHTAPSAAENLAIAQALDPSLLP